MAPRKRCRQPYGGFDFQNSYCRLGVVSHQREVQMNLDGDVSVHELDFQLRQGGEAVSRERLMDTRLEPSAPLEKQLVLESFGSISMFSCAELGSQCRPWAVQHLGDIREPNIPGSIPKPIRRSLFRIPFQSTAEDF